MKRENVLATQTFVWASLVVTLVLSALPLPAWAAWYRPAFVAMALIYWGINLPQRVQLFTAFALGILLDSLYGTLLGQHALALVFVVFIANKLHRVYQQYYMWQRVLWIGLLVLIYQLLIFIVHGVLGNISHHYWFWLPAVSSMILWPFIEGVLRVYQRACQLY